MARLLPDRYFFNRICWNPYRKVVMDPATGYVILKMTDEERKKRGLPVPWRPEMMAGEMQSPPIP